MNTNQTTFAGHLRTACRGRGGAAFKDDLLLKRADGSYFYTAGPLANNHPDTDFARAYKKAYNVGVDKTRKLQIQTYASKALKKVRLEEKVTPAANGNQGNGGNGAANVLPRFIILGALLAFFCAALGSYSLRDSCVHLTVVEGSSNNAMYAGWWRNVSMSMCFLLGQGGNTTHEGGGNILGTSPDFDTISGEGEGAGARAGGSASTSTEESRDKSINTTAGQSNFSSATGGGIACHSHQSGDEGNTTHEGGGGYGSTQEGSDISGAVGSVVPTIAGEGSIDFDACNATSDKAGSNATSSKNSGAENICNATAPAIGNSVFTSTSGGGTANHFQSAQGQGDNTTHEGGENILGTSPDFDTISGAGEGAGGSASTPTEKTRDISTNTTAGQSNCTTPSCQPSSQGPTTGDVSEGALDNGNGGDQSEFDKLHLHQVVASQNYELARLRKILWATAVIIIALLFLLCYNLRQKSAERIVSQQRFDQLVLCHRTIQHAGATETLLRANITRLGDGNRTLQNSLEEAQAQVIEPEVAIARVNTVFGNAAPPNNHEMLGVDGNLLPDDNGAQPYDVNVEAEVAVDDDLGGGGEGHQSSNNHLQHVSAAEEAKEETVSDDEEEERETDDDLLPDEYGAQPDDVGVEAEVAVDDDLGGGGEGHRSSNNHLQHVPAAEEAKEETVSDDDEDSKHDDEQQQQHSDAVVIQHAGATETLLRAIITRLGDENRTLQNSLEEAQAQLTRLRPPFFFRNEYESAADECKDDSSYSSHLSHGSSNEERRNDEAYSIFASTSSSTHHPTQSSDSSIDTSSEGNISTPPKPTIETLASEVRELREIVDDNSEESVVDSDDDQGKNCLLEKLKRRIEEESDRGDDNQSTVNQLVNDVAGLLIDIENTNYLLNMLLDRPAGEETLAIMRRQRSRIDTFQRERNAEFRYVQLERAAAMERLNHNVYQSSDEESNDEMMIEQLNRNVYQFSDEESNDD